ncbi:hypothetical protein FB567DRAFT_114777 [Paraphoma chrysanthemicola]|uniref:Uncharacterized protein n=1 Tax=Paraphoma chrysanthemicola TaxID=798071 RepID=A0A8K0R2K1_9PLEO|nr:hypothetical protein FB567DRAFT_114777 [Paraphoma chrysanthemicola]
MRCAGATCRYSDATSDAAVGQECADAVHERSRDRQSKKDAAGGSDSWHAAFKRSAQLSYRLASRTRSSWPGGSGAQSPHGFWQCFMVASQLAPDAGAHSASKLSTLPRPADMGRGLSISTTERGPGTERVTQATLAKSRSHSKKAAPRSSYSTGQAAIGLVVHDVDRRKGNVYFRFRERYRYRDILSAPPLRPFIDYEIQYCLAVEC